MHFVAAMGMAGDQQAKRDSECVHSRRTSGAHGTFRSWKIGVETGWPLSGLAGGSREKKLLAVAQGDECDGVSAVL